MRPTLEADGWRSLAISSAKLDKIPGGHGYRPAVLSMAGCADAAIRGKIAPSG